MKNNGSIVLIGMPGCGKSTLGVLLAKSMLYSFADTDLIIQKREGEPLYRSVDRLGREGFSALEENVVTHLENVSRTVIATGGSVVYSESSMAHLKELGTVVYIKLPADEIIRRVKNITSRGIVMEKGQTLEGLYAERVPLYEKYADIVADCTGLDMEASVEKVLEAISAQYHA